MASKIEANGQFTSSMTNAIASKASKSYSASLAKSATAPKASKMHNMRQSNHIE